MKRFDEDIENTLRDFCLFSLIPKSSIYSIFIPLSYCYKGATASAHAFSSEPDSNRKIISLLTRKQIHSRYENDFSEIFCMYTSAPSTTGEPSFPQKNRPTLHLIKGVNLQNSERFFLSSLTVLGRQIHSGAPPSSLPQFMTFPVAGLTTRRITVLCQELFYYHRSTPILI
jgi:hypothetical protein